MPEKKEFARTVRMKESIRQYVEQQPGCNFNEKFETMIRFCMENEGVIKKRIKDLEAQCAGERKRLEELKAMNGKLNSIKWKIDQALAEAERLN